jgi:hypothetical protein
MHTHKGYLLALVMVYKSITLTVLFVCSLFNDAFSVIGSRVSSGSIVSDYGPDDWEIEVRSPAGARDFSCSLCVQTPVQRGGGPFPSGKAWPERDADHSPPFNAEVVNE